MRLDYLHPESFPDVPLVTKYPPSPQDEYPQRLDLALREWYRNWRRSVRELDSPPQLVVVRQYSDQPLTPGVATRVQFNSTVIDTPQGGYNGTLFEYAPQEPGFYQCNWVVNFHDTVAPATSTYAYSELVGAGLPYRVHVYGNGVGLDIFTQGSAVVECNGTQSLSVNAFIYAGTAPVVYQAPDAYRSWLSVTYLGRRYVPT